jgi:alpha-tubulin suppressor-like RCC1 family protein
VLGTREPVTRGAQTTATAVSVGVQFDCAVIAGGGVECWGSNVEAKLGNNSTTTTCAFGGNVYPCSLTPVQVTGLTSGVTAVSGSCAVTANGGVECWGPNDSGELGNDSGAGSSYVPVPVFGLTSGVTAVSVSAVDNFACAVTAGGGVECWGDNYSGELGNNSTTNSSVPVQVSGL